MTTSWLHATATGLWLCFAAPQPPDDGQTRAPTPAAEADTDAGNRWAPVVVACVGVVVGAWLARRQIQNWKQKGG